MATLDSPAFVWLASARPTKPLSVICASVPALVTPSTADPASPKHGDLPLLQGVPPRASDASRLPFLDLVRAVGAQLIVLHHLALYGPLADRAYVTAPVVFDWLVDYARMAVQVFLVMGGFFAARSLSRYDSIDTKRLVRAIGSRFWRIAIPYWVTLVLAVFANEVARQYMSHAAISARPTFGQLVAHVSFLHDLLGYEALTAGIWYLAIDLQLYLLTLLAYWCSLRWLRRFTGTSNWSVWQLALLALAPFAVLSLAWFNRQRQLDSCALYFLGSYFLGLLLHEAVVNRRARRWVVTYVGLAVAVGVVDSRPRIVVAAAVVILVLIADRTELLDVWPSSRIFRYLGRSSYSLFLVHFPVLLVINALGHRYFAPSAGSAVVGLLIAYVVSLGASSLLYHAVEKRIQ